MKLVLRRSCELLALLMLAAAPRADDIDVYRGERGPAAGPLRVMLAIDFRADAADVICRDAAADSCRAALGEPLYRQLDLYGRSAADAGDSEVERGADGAPDETQSDPRQQALSLAQTYWPATEVTGYDLLRAALRRVLGRVADSLRRFPNRSGGVEVGLMAVHGDSCDGAGPGLVADYGPDSARPCSQGAYVLQGFTDISVPANLDRLLRRLAAIPEPGKRAPWMAVEWTGHPYKIRDIYFELFRYLSGQQVFSGFLGADDYGSRYPGNLYHDLATPVANDVLVTPPEGGGARPLLAPDMAILVPSSFDLDADDVAAARYAGPVSPTGECPRVRLVHVLFGDVSSSHPDVDRAIAAPPAAGGMGISLPAGLAGDIALAAALSGADTASGLPRVTSHVLARNPDPAADALASAGGSQRAGSLDHPQRLVSELEALFSDVEATSGTMLAGATPVNVLDRSRGTGDIYFALFEAAPGRRWRGNIKKFRFTEVAETDAESGETSSRKRITPVPVGGVTRAALSPEDGLIRQDALSYWTDPAGADVQAFDPTRGEVSGRDGRSVTRGGAGQQIPGFIGGRVGDSSFEAGARRLFTLDPVLPGRLLALDASTATRAALGDYLAAGDELGDEEQLTLIRWIRGQDVFDADGDGDLADARPWLLGDVIHSRPLAINYGARAGTGYTAANPDIRIFFGTNDGFFHMLQNTHQSGADLESGRETWAFIPPELLAMQADLAGMGTRGAPGHTYGMDGEAVALVEDVDRDGNIERDDGDRVWVFIGQRRGGRALYAFDMTDPDDPRFKWVIDHTTPGFGQLALTFSTPRTARLDLGDDTPTPVLVFAGGYNGGRNEAGPVGKDAGGGSDTIGNAVYVVAADDGRLLWRAVGPDGGQPPLSDETVRYVAAMTDSIPSPLTVIDSDVNGVEDRAYVGDSGGNVWRITMTEAAARPEGSTEAVTSDWRVSRLGQLGGSGVDNRRFFHAPDVVHSLDSAGSYFGVVLVSGNRAAPGDLAAADYAFLLKDRESAVTGVQSGAEAGPAGPLGPAQLADISAGCSPGGDSRCVAPDTAAGWKLPLASPGEKGVSPALVTNGVVLFTSYAPADPALADPCAPGTGRGRAYAVRLADGSPALPPAAELGQVRESGRYLDTGPGMPGRIVPYERQVLLPGRGVDGGQLLGIPGRTRWRTYWREEEVDAP